MRYYESLYIVNPNFEQERLNEVKNEVAKKVEGYGFKIINHRVWGKKRLAYAIQKHKYGTYILLQFETDNVSRLADFERYMVLNKAILRNQTVRLEQRPEVFEEKEPETRTVSEVDSKPVEKETAATAKAGEPQEDESAEVNSASAGEGEETPEEKLKEEVQE